jgi:hypothetical protein
MLLGLLAYYIMPPIPPISGIPPPAPAGSGISATTASVVKNIAATDAAFCNAERVTNHVCALSKINRLLHILIFTNQV